MFRIDKITYRIAGRVLLDQAEATINTGHRVGLVGRNGTGKTTLLRLIAGELEADDGAIELPRRWRVGLTSQEAPSGRQSLIDVVLGADQELADLHAEADEAQDPHRIAEIHERLRDKDSHAAHARAARILAGLGFDEAAQQKPCDDYSGGWRMRVALAALLFTAPDLLLLDEPTNHLDLEAALWLEDYLRHYSGTILLVSHDRDLLNRAVGEILHLEHNKLRRYQGGYDRFEETRRQRLEQDEKQRVKQDARRAELQGFVDRFRYKATKAKQAQSRLKMLERLQPIPEHHEEGAANFSFPQPDPLPPPLYAMDRVAVGYDGAAVLDGLDLRLDQDDRIALLGANGNGKSTFIKLLAGRLEPLSGNVTTPGKLRVGYFAQHQAEELDLTATPLVEMGRKRPGEREELIRRHLGSFGFSRERAETRVGSLSGGEKARLLFALMTADKPHILLLDEPTNHLDVAARQALIEAINAFEGAVVIVSHDPHVIELTVDRFWLVDKGGVAPFDGDMEDYRALQLAQVRTGKNNGNGRAKSNGNGQNNKKEKRRRAAQGREAQKALSRAERKVARLEATRAELQQALADPDQYQGDGGKPAKLQTQLEQVEADLEAAEEAWISLQEG